MKKFVKIFKKDQPDGWSFLNGPGAKGSASHNVAQYILYDIIAILTKKAKYPVEPRDKSKLSPLNVILE